MIAGTSSAALTETFEALGATGTLSATDVDGTNNLFQAQTGVAGSNGYGTFNVSTSGVWSYTMDSAHNEFVKDQTYTDSFTVKAADGTEQVVTVTITGTNDAAVIAGTSSGSVSEDNAISMTTGVLTLTDVDTGEEVFEAPSAASLVGMYGRFVFNEVTGEWKYTLDNTLPEVQALTDGETVTDTLSVSSVDGTGNKVVTVTIVGTNDGSNFSGDSSKTISETDVIQTVTGSLTATVSVSSEVAPLISLGNKGNLISPITVDGGVTYYFWDKNGDGTSNNTSDAFGGYSTDYVTSTSDISTVWTDAYGNPGQLSAIYRYTTINGVSVALPVSGVGGGYRGFSTGTSVGSTPAENGSNETNQTYDGLAAIWDAYNGAIAPGSNERVIRYNGDAFLIDSTNVSGVPLGWSQHIYSQYLSADFGVGPGGTWRTAFDMSSGRITYLQGFSVSGSIVTVTYVALEVINPPMVNTFDNPTTFIAQTDVSGSSGLGKFSITSSGAWTYVMNTAQNQLTSTDVIKDSLTVTSADGTPHVISVLITGTNDAPSLAIALADSIVTEGMSLTYMVPDNAFSDVDNATLTYSATMESGSALPDWLAFNASTRTFSGTPPTGSAGTVSVKVIATDSSSMSASDVFDIAIEESKVAPVALDLNHDGDIGYTQQLMDINTDGKMDYSAWVSREDGVLVWDKFGNGSVTDKSQYSFTKYGGSTDLEGLRIGFDSNKDGVFDFSDATFAEFGVWQDANGNGVSDEGELRSLADWGIASIHLTSDNVQRVPSEGVSEAGRTIGIMADGSSILIADAIFDFQSLLLKGGEGVLIF